VKKVGNLDEQPKASKKLKGKPKIEPSKLSTSKWSRRTREEDESDKGQEDELVVDEERVIEPEICRREQKSLMGIEEYDVQDLLKRHNIRFC